MSRKLTATSSFLTVAMMLSSMYAVILMNRTQQALEYRPPVDNVVATPVRDIIGIIPVDKQKLAVRIAKVSAQPNSIEIFLRFDPEEISIDSLEPYPDPFDTVIINKVDANLGLAQYTATSLDQQAIPSGALTVFTFNYTKLKNTETTVQFTALDPVSQTRYIDVDLIEHQFQIIRDITL